MTRVVGREMLLGDVEKEHMRQLIRRVEGFSGVRVLTYAVMTNHVHLLLEEPDRDSVVTDAVLMERLRALYTEEEMGEIVLRWSDWEEQGNLFAVEEDKRRYSRRMHDISDFMKTLKHRFSFWYNRMHGRKGTLWEERFKSVLVEGGDVLRTVAAYIEMNPVRAGMVNDPMEYCFCGLGEAMGGSRRARAGIGELMRLKRVGFGLDTDLAWEKVLSQYAEEVLHYGVKGDDEQRGVARTNRFLSRCRYFTDGQVLGSKDFVEEFFSEHRDYFGPRRSHGGRKVKGDWEHLYAVRDVGRVRPASENRQK